MLGGAQADVFDSITIILIASVTVVSCGGGGSGTQTGGPAAAAASLCIVGGFAAEVDAYDAPATESGTLSPDRVISGASTTIQETFGGACDSRTDTLFVADYTGADVLIYDGVSPTTGNVAPSRVVAGSNTGLAGPMQVAVDESRDLLYVSDKVQIDVFANAKTVDGNVAPARVIVGAKTGFSSVGDLRIVVDPYNDRLYVADPDNSTPSIFVFNNASTADGNIAPDRTIAGSKTQFDYPWRLALDTSRDLLYVGNQSNAQPTGSIEMFANAGSINGNVAPTHVISGTASTISDISDLYVDPVTDTAYALDSTNDLVLIWNNASTVDGDMAPDRTINGGFGYPGGIVGAQ